MRGVENSTDIKEIRVSNVRKKENLVKTKKKIANLYIFLLNIFKCFEPHIFEGLE